MKQKVPNSPFATRLSVSAKETELRLRSIFQWKKKRPPVILLLAAVLLIAGCGSLIGFTSEDPAETEGQTVDPFVENGALTEIPGYRNTSTPEFFNDVGKTLSELKNEHPEGELIVSLDGFPDCAAACFGEQGAEYVYYFFGTQSGDSEKAMNECEDQLKCAGFLTTADILFPDMEDDMSFEDFFSLIGVDDYEYLGEDTAGAGWLRFMYSGMRVMVNTNEITAGGGWHFTGAERVKSNAPVSIVDPEISNTNFDLAEPVMFEEDEEQETVPPEELTAMEAYKAVLRGEMEFLNTPHYDSFDISRVQEAITPDTSITLEPEYFAVVDLDGDGTEEVILAVAIVGVGVSNYVVLRWQDGIVYGYPFAEREFSDLKTDGTFWNTGGAANIGICRVTFDKDTKSIDRFSFTWERHTEEGDGISYFVDHQETTQEEWERVLSQWNEIPYAEWYEFTDANIEAMLS